MIKYLTEILFKNKNLEDIFLYTFMHLKFNESMLLIMHKNDYK